MRNIGMTVAYEGTAYCGFQAQPEDPTVQGCIEAVLKQLTGETISILASGRTDAGVHAQGQVFNFLTESQIPVERWMIAMNSRLPKDIVITEVWEAPLDFHSRYSAKRKTYRYSIYSERVPDLFTRRTELFHPRPLKIDAMKEAMSYFEGEHDFTSFASPKSTKTSNIRTIYQSWLEHEPSCTGHPDRGRIHLYITGNGFLYNMVRIIAGTVLQVGQGKRRPDQIPEIIQARDRYKAGPTAIPCGLMLWKVEYDGLERL